MTKPKAVIVTGVLYMPPCLDVTSAFRTMRVTKDIPVALINANTRDDVIAGGLRTRYW